MNKKLKSKLVISDLKKTLESKGYIYFTRGLYNLNIIGIRSNNDNKITNEYDDLLVVEYTSGNNKQQLVYSITTEPGVYYMKQKLLNFLINIFQKVIFQMIQLKLMIKK